MNLVKDYTQKSTISTLAVKISVSAIIYPWWTATPNIGVLKGCPDQLGVHFKFSTHSAPPNVGGVVGVPRLTNGSISSPDPFCTTTYRGCGRGAQIRWGCTLSPPKEVWFKSKGVHFKCSEVWWKCAPPTDQGSYKYCQITIFLFI